MGRARRRAIVRATSRATLLRTLSTLAPSSVSTTPDSARLNRILPHWTRRALHRAAVSTIPSMRHLDMAVRLRHMASLGFQLHAIVDVGAAEGTWSRLAAAIWPHAHVIAFEPNRRNEPRLQEARRELLTSPTT